MTRQQEACATISGYAAAAIDFWIEIDRDTGSESLNDVLGKIERVLRAEMSYLMSPTPEERDDIREDTSRVRSMD